jgi:hypothetical protein
MGVGPNLCLAGGRGLMALLARVDADLPAGRDGWSAIHDPGVRLVLDPAPAPDEAWVADLLARAPFAWRAEGRADTIDSALADWPGPLREMVAAHAARFAAVMEAPAIAVRIEGITGNACTRVHADYTDVRLIRTLAGPGTDHLPDGPSPEANGADGADLARVPTGWVGLFKGRTYPGADGCCHPPCLHRSPPVEGTGARRLVLVIDTIRSAGTPVLPIRA